MPQRGYGLQPRVAASATLGTSKKRNFNRNAVASFSQKEMHEADATALRLRTRSLSLLPAENILEEPHRVGHSQPSPRLRSKLLNERKMVAIKTIPKVEGIE